MLVQFILGAVFIIFPLTLVFALPLIGEHLAPKSKLTASLEDCDTIFTDEPAYIVKAGPL